MFTKYSIVLVAVVIAVAVSSRAEDTKYRDSVKKELDDTPPAPQVAAQLPVDAVKVKPSPPQSPIAAETPTTKPPVTSNMNNFLQKGKAADELPESFKTAFYIIVSISIAGLLFVLVKIYKLRLNRAERRYGVLGDRSAQELTPLPMAIDDDSDNDDHTLFDAKRQTRVP